MSLHSTVTLTAQHQSPNKARRGCCGQTLEQAYAAGGLKGYADLLYKFLQSLFSYTGLAVTVKRLYVLRSRRAARRARPARARSYGRVHGPFKKGSSRKILTVAWTDLTMCRPQAPSVQGPQPDRHHAIDWPNKHWRHTRPTNCIKALKEAYLLAEFRSGAGAVEQR